MARWSLFTQGILTVVPVGVFLMLGMWLAGGEVIERRLEAELKGYIADTGRREAARIQVRLDATRGFVTSLARNDLVINGLIDVSGRASYLPAFFRSLETPGFGAAHLHLRDYRGRIIVQNEGVSELGRAAGPGPMQSGLPPVASPTSLIFEEPVLYFGSPEGSLEIIYPASSFSRLFGSSPFGDEFFVVNRDGIVIYSTNAALAKVGQHRNTDPDRRWIEVGSELDGYGLSVFVASSRAKWAQPIDAVRRWQLLSLGIFIAVAIGMTLLVVYRTSGPLKAFTGAIAKIGSGKDGIQQRLPERGPRELAEMARAFNGMAEKVDAAMYEKEENIVFVEQILNSLPSPILVHGSGQIVGINAAFFRLFGVAASKRIGRDCAELLREIRLDAEMVKRIADGERFVNLDGFCERLGGQKVHVIISQNAFAPNRDAKADGSLLVTMTDVTWRDEMEAEKDVLARELREAQKLEAIGQLAGGIAHEINTPSQYVGDNLEFLASAFEDLLAVIQTFSKAVEAMRDRRDFAPEIEHLEAAIEAADLNYVMRELPTAVEHSREGIRQISRIVLAMKEFSHPSAKEKSFIDLNHALENTLTISRNAWKHVAQVELRLDPELGRVPCLPGEMNQVFLNLVVNAAHALAEAGRTPESGRITVSTRRDSESAFICIADNGTGIPADIQEKVFNPFFTTKEVGKGTGQGLAIAQDIIVTKHGGRIGFETNVGKGTVFTIRLPLVSPMAADESWLDPSGKDKKS